MRGKPGFVSFSRRILFLIVISLVIVACEQVVDIDLNVAKPKLVIEGVISNLDHGVYVNLSQTSSYFDNDKISTFISKAKVIISDNAGNQELLIETDSGHYEASIISGVPGRTYQLSIDVAGEIYEASSMMKDIPVLDSFTFEKRIFYDMDNQTFDTSYYPYCHFIDPVQTEDNYRMKVYKGINEVSLQEFMYLFEDDLINGDTIHYGAYGRFNSSGVKARIELVNMEQKIYNYFVVLDQAVNSNIDIGTNISSAPTNPPSNISNGALGYFGCFAIASVDTIVP